MAGPLSHEAIARAGQEARARTDAWPEWKKQLVALSEAALQEKLAFWRSVRPRGLGVGSCGTAGARGAP